MLAGLQAAAAFAGQQDGQVVGIVAVAVGETGAAHNHRIVQERLVAFLDRFQAREQIDELFDVPARDDLVGIDLGLLLALALEVGSLTRACRRRTADARLLETRLAKRASGKVESFIPHMLGRQPAALRIFEPQRPRLIGGQGRTSYLQMCVDMEYTG